METLLERASSSQNKEVPRERRWHQWYEEGVPLEMEFVNRSIPGNLFATADRYPERRALVFRNAVLTYRELADDVCRFASALRILGVRSGSRIAIDLPNLPQTVIGYYAALAAGAEVVMTNPMYVEREIIHQWNDAGVEVAIVGDWLFDQRIRGIRDELPVRNYVTTGIADFLKAPLRWLALAKLMRQGMAPRLKEEPNVYDLSHLLRASEASFRFEERDLDSVAVLQYTGGTTGVAKGAMLTHRNLSYNVQQTAAWFPALRPAEDTWLACLPYFHIFGMTIAMNWPVMMGGTIILMPNPRDIREMIGLIQDHRVTIYPSLPALFVAITNHSDSKKADLSSIKGCFTGSAPLPVRVLEDFEALTGGRIVEGFGMSETSPVTICNPVRGNRKPGSIGIPLPNTDARIVDMVDGISDVTPGEEGELILRGPQVMSGYWNRPDETATTIRDGWLFTGDLARIDEDGYFWISGRKKELIVASGYKIFPDEIDGVLTSHPAVLESATIGIPDPKRGETVKSFVVLKPGQEVTKHDLLGFCRRELAAYKVPKQIEFRDSLPRSAIQKILRRQLLEEEMKSLSS